MLDLRFIMIEGTPPRDVVKIENLWTGNYGLNNIATTVAAKTVTPDPTASMYRAKVTTTGHGFGTGNNCAEFCNKLHSFKVNGGTWFFWWIVQECALNPLYPQGGTWIYDRAGWCPGMEGKTQDLELTPYLTPGVPASLDYDPGTDPDGNYVIESQLVSYTNPNFTLDAAIDDIIAPNSWEGHFRYNPICNNPKIRIKNTGSSSLTSLNIAYGPMGGNTGNFNWTGNLAFLETAMVDLPAFNWGSWSPPHYFEVTASNPNGGADQYAFNNTYRAPFSIPPRYDNQFVVWFKTNNAVAETKWQILDENGAILFQSSPFLQANFIHKDTVSLPAGCYTFKLSDTGDDGLSFFANNDGNGYLNLFSMAGSLFKQFQPNFGDSEIQQFTVDFTLPSVDPIQQYNVFEVYPNPSGGLFNADIAFDHAQDFTIRITDMLGRVIETVTEKNLQNAHKTFDLSEQGAGIYFVNLHLNGKVITRKVVKQ